MATPDMSNWRTLADIRRQYEPTLYDLGITDDQEPGYARRLRAHPSCPEPGTVRRAA
jgi:hypothetical protein